MESLSSEEFFHASTTPLEIGTVLQGRGGGCGEEVEELLDSTRPRHAFPRHESVFKVNDIGTLDAVVSSYEHVYAVNPRGAIQRYDAIWLDRLLSGFSGTDNNIEFPEADQSRFAQGYWSGEPCPLLAGERTSWEYLCASATVEEKIEV